MLLDRDVSLYGITRVDNPAKRQHGWQVTIARRCVRYQRFFPDVLCRGRHRALRSAKKFRDEMAPEPLLSRQDYGAIVRKSNNSGYPGVCRTLVTNKKGNQSAVWLAFWPKGGGKTGRAKFSIAKHGEGLAFQLAVKARQEALSRLEGPHITYPLQREWQDRRHQRHAKSLEVILEIGDKVNNAMMRDISRGGCGIETSDPIVEKSRVCIVLPDGFRVDGKVVWVGVSRAGIAFDRELSDRQLQEEFGLVG